MGKTTIINRLLGNPSGETSPTISPTFHPTKLLVWEGRELKVKLVDTAGQERFRSMTQVYFTGRQMIILVFSARDDDFQKNVSEWIERIRSRNKTCVILLVANKTDLCTDAVLLQKAESWLSFAGDMPFIDISARTGSHFDEFENLISKLLVEHHVANKPTSELSLETRPQKQCCK